MKIALVFSGQPRFIDGMSYNSIKEFFLNKYDCDVYAHFWFSQDTSTSYETAPWSTLGNISFPSDTLDIFNKLYNPVKLSFDEPLVHDDKYKKYTNSHSHSGYLIYSTYTSLQKAYKLIDNINQYDYIIKIRPDIIFNIKFDVNNIDPHSIHVIPMREHPDILYNDTFAIVPPSISNYFFNMVDYIDKYYTSGTLCNHEEMFTAHVISSNYRINPIDMSKFRFGYIRNGERIQWHN